MGPISKGPKNIVSLVLSLGAREKRFFKKSYDSENEFVQLFDFIVKNKSFSVPEFNRYLANRQGRSELYTSGYISTLRKYLRDKLLLSLRQLHSTDNPTIRLWNHLGTSQLLVNRGLFRTAQEEFEASLEFKEQLLPLETLQLLQQKNILQMAMEFEGVGLKDVLELHIEQKKKVKEYLIEVELTRIISLLSLFLYKNITDRERIQAVENEEILKIDTDALGFGGRYLYEWAHAQIFLIKGQFGKAFGCFNKVISIWTDEPKMIESYPDLFLGCCVYYFRFFQFRYPGKFEGEDLEHVDKFLNLIKNAGEEIGQPERVNFYIRHFEPVKQFASGHYQKVINFIPKLDNIFNKGERIIGLSPVFFTYLVALSYCKLREFKSCTEHLSDIIKNKKSANDNPLFFSKANILYLMSALAGGLEATVISDSKKNERRLKNLDLFGTVEEHFFSFLHQFFLKKNSDRIPELISKLKTGLTEAFENPALEAGYRDLEILEWADIVLASSAMPGKRQAGTH